MTPARLKKIENAAVQDEIYELVAEIHRLREGSDAVIVELHAHRTVINDSGVCAPLMTPEATELYKAWCDEKNISPVKPLVFGDYAARDAIGGNYDQ